MRIAKFTCALATAALSLAQEPQAPLAHELGRANSADAPSYRRALLSLHKSLITTQSISGDEQKVGDVLAEYLELRGYKVERQWVHPRNETPEGEERHNIIAWHGKGSVGPRVLVTSHIDVVPPHIPYQIDDGDVTRDTMIRGRGSVDAKGSIAAMVTAVEDLKLSKATDFDPAQVGLVFVVGEEVGGEGMRTFSRSVEDSDGFDAVIFGEPTENKLACGHKGGLTCDLYVKGLGGHSGYPWLGKSANELLIRAMAKVLSADLGSSKQFGNTTVNVGRLEGGVAANVIAEDAHAKLMIRVAVGPEVGGSQVVQDRIQAILDEVDKEAFTFDCIPGYGFIKTECDVEGFETIAVNYGTDVPQLKGNHTRYLYGPGTIFVAHGARENLTVGDLETAVEGYKKLILHALKQ